MRFTELSVLDLMAELIEPTKPTGSMVCFSLSPDDPSTGAAVRSRERTDDTESPLLKRF
jgi:hypothetical protein